MTSPRSDLTRRRLLGLGLATAGAMALESVPGAAALAREVGGPRATAAALRLPRARRIGPVTVPGGLDLAGLRWSGHAHPRIDLRARRRGGRWSPWTPIGHAHDHGPDGAAGPGTDPVWLGRRDEVELRMDRPVDGLTLHTVRTDGARRRPRARAAQVAPGAPPVIITRDQWGGDRLKTRGTPAYGTVEMAFVHHTVNANDYGPEESAAIVLAIAKYHIDSNRWNDIGYNFLVDQYGQIFEGREGGIDQAVIGAQAQGFNSVSTGVANIGTFESVPQTDAALNAMAKLIAWKLSLHGVPVEGAISVASAGGPSSRYPKGRQVTFQRICGHRDGDKTSCPGSALYAQLPEIRRRAALQHFPVAVDPAAQPDELTVAAAASEVAAYSEVELSGFLRGQQGAPVPGARIAIQARGATRWNTLARTQTDASGRYAAPVTVKANARLRAYYGGDSAAGAAPLASSTVDVKAVPALTLGVSNRRVPAGGRVRVSVGVKPNRARVDLAVAERGRDGRYRTIRRHRLTVRGSKASIVVPLSRPGLYRFVVSSPADSKAAAARTPDVFVRATKGGGRGPAVRSSSGGAGQPLTGAGGSGGVAAAR